MPDVTLMALQARGKVRRFIQSNFQKAATEQALARRQGDCNRCGACCKILFKCPFLGEDADGQFTCKIYDKRFAQCRMFPIHAKDLREVAECSYTFEASPGEAPAPINAAAGSF